MMGHNILEISRENRTDILTFSNSQIITFGFSVSKSRIFVK